MKQPLLFLCILLTVHFANAQTMDTLLHEDFNVIFDSIPEDDGAGDGVSLFPLGNDQIWINLDADGISDNNGTPSGWIWDPTDFSGDTTNGIMTSLSWMAGFADGNKNFLITPPITVSDASAMVYWRSAPFQGPRYMDGYSVAVSTTTNDPGLTPFDNSPFTDTLFVGAQMLPPLPDSASILPASLNPEIFTFSPGYVHADGFTLTDYYFWDSTGTAYDIILEPHSASLSAYVGQTIYLTFIHDSDDDYYFSIDDILIVEESTVNVNDPTLEANLKIFPNPVSDILRIQFDILKDAEVGFEITDVLGRTVLTSDRLSSGKGYFIESINVSDLSYGVYTFRLITDGQILKTQKFIKE